MMAHILSEDRIDYLRRPLVARFGLLGGMLFACAVASETEGEGSRRADGDGIAEGAPRVEEKIVIDRIWPAVPVGYCLLTHGNRQYVAYYNADRRMVVAQRTLGEDTFEKFVLPSESDAPPRQSSQTSTIQGWDSHNYITMALDSAGHIHLSGNNQAYAARVEDGNWVIRQLTDWKYRWHFSGGGSVSAHIRIGGAKPHGQGKLAVPYNHATFGNGLLILDEKTLKPIGSERATKQSARYPTELMNVTSAFPDMRVKWCEDIGKSPAPNLRYALRWETLGPNRDRPRKPPFPESGELILYRLKDR